MEQQRNDRHLTHFNRHGQLYIGTTTHSQTVWRRTHSRDRDFVKIGGYSIVHFHFPVVLAEIYSATKYIHQQPPSIPIQWSYRRLCKRFMVTFWGQQVTTLAETLSRTDTTLLKAFSAKYII